MVTILWRRLFKPNNTENDVDNPFFKTSSIYMDFTKATQNVEICRLSRQYLSAYFTPSIEDTMWFTLGRRKNIWFRWLVDKECQQKW